MTSDIEKSFKAKLRAIAKEKKRDPADLWQNLILERFLVRLANSRHCKHFVLKGGILLSKYIEIGRETTDLDFLGRGLSNDFVDLIIVFEEIASIDLKDGFTFQDIKVTELRHPHMGYPGVDVSMMAHFGKTRFKVTIDIGFGDIVNAVEYAIPLTTYSKGVLFEHNVKLPCYPKEFIFAEKLETIIYRGSFNSRMKDFHDLYSLISNSKRQPFQNLEGIISLVFEHRETPLNLPIANTDEEIEQLQNYWSEYFKNLRAENAKSLPSNVAQVINTINNWLNVNTRLLNSRK